MRVDELRPVGDLVGELRLQHRRRSESGLDVDLGEALATLSLPFTASGIPAGPNRPHQKARSTSAVVTPPSRSVGNSGSTGERSDEVTASPFTWPCAISPRATGMADITASMCPAATSAIAWPPPL